MPTGAPAVARCPTSTSPTKSSTNWSAFLKYTSEINTANWPPNIEG